MDRVKEKFGNAPPSDPVVVACVVLQSRDARHLLDLLREAVATLADHASAGPPVLPTVPQQIDPEGPWLTHTAAAEYLGISKSTLYKYACQQRIECRKLGGRLEYRRSLLDSFKEEQIRPARHSAASQSIITSALGSGK